MQNNYNLAVIGAGPAGLMAAGHAGELGARVILLEKNDHIGRKLLITGKGRCNITNAEPNLKIMMSAFGKKGRFLRSALGKFSNQHTVDFFNKHGVPTKVERGARVFPASDKAGDVADCLWRYIKASNNVDILFKSPVENVVLANDNKGQKHIKAVTLPNGRQITADYYLFATGGKSYPRTGSTGDACKWLRLMGHTVVELKPALTPVIVKEPWVKELEGLSLKNVEASVWQGGKRASHFGEALFTNNGLSGPIILNLSKNIQECNTGPLTIKIDFKPALDYATLDKRVQRDFAEQNNKQFKNSLKMLLPAKLIPVIIMLSGIDPDKQINEVTRVERKNLLALLKEFTLTYKGLAGFEKAIITAGGVSLNEVDPKTMKSKIVGNACFAGELLDLDGPTGGYNLQAAWSTGYLAGECLKCHFEQSPVFG